MQKQAIMQMPLAECGRQANLNPEFSIRPLPTLTKNKVPVQDAEQFRVCLYCQVPIWNRGWTCKETLETGAVELEGHHCCSGCFAEGLVCQSRHTMVMVERFDVKELMKRYRDAVAVYNNVLYPARKQYGFYTANPPGIDLCFDSEFKLIDEYLQSDPRPKLGRSEVTVSYHLNIRNICEYPGANCHQCKSKRPSWEIVTCSNHAHIELAVSNPQLKSRSGYYYCSRCLHNRYQERAINVWGDRNWHCFVCRQSCDCAACQMGNTPLAPGVQAKVSAASHIIRVKPPAAIPATKDVEPDADESKQRKILPRTANATAARQKKRKIEDTAHHTSELGTNAQMTAAEDTNEDLSSDDGAVDNSRSNNQTRIKLRSIKPAMNNSTAAASNSQPALFSAPRAKTPMSQSMPVLNGTSLF